MPPKKDLPPFPPVKVDMPNEKKVLMYGYCQTSLAGHFTVFKIEIPVSDVRLISVGEKLPKRAAFEKVLYLVREQLFRAAAPFKRAPQNEQAP